MQAGDFPEQMVILPDAVQALSFCMEDWRSYRFHNRSLPGAHLFERHQQENIPIQQAVPILFWQKVSSRRVGGKMLNILRFKYGKSWIHRVEDILLGFEPKDAGSIPAGSVNFQYRNCITLLIQCCSVTVNQIRYLFLFLWCIH